LAIGDCSVAQRTGGRFLNNQQLLTAARSGDTSARAIWLDSVRALAAGISSVVNAVSPELVLLGGGTAKAGDDLFRPLRRFLADFEWRPTGAPVKLRPARLGELAGAYGAAWKALNCASLGDESDSAISQVKRL
jgi:glucokinase